MAELVPVLRTTWPEQECVVIGVLWYLIWASVTAGHAPPAFLDAIAAAAEVCLEDSKSQELTNTMWSSA
eukprot:10980198-Karenia_brevis.AAC.1